MLICLLFLRFFLRSISCGLYLVSRARFKASRSPRVFKAGRSLRVFQLVDLQGFNQEVDHKGLTKKSITKGFNQEGSQGFHQEVDHKGFTKKLITRVLLGFDLSKKSIKVSNFQLGLLRQEVNQSCSRT